MSGMDDVVYHIPAVKNYVFDTRKQTLMRSADKDCIGIAPKEEQNTPDSSFSEEADEEEA